MMLAELSVGLEEDWDISIEMMKVMKKERESRSDGLFKFRVEAKIPGTFSVQGQKRWDPPKTRDRFRASPSPCPTVTLL